MTYYHFLSFSYTKPANPTHLFLYTKPLISLHPFILNPPYLVPSLLTVSSFIAD
ncbi:hypothetical protein HanIR_Chr01g0049001 [Helianthus annuus]|nr:hypothetical protein HanIR_Chr01g0049001 [Helianthus annuus]